MSKNTTAPGYVNQKKEPLPVEVQPPTYQPTAAELAEDLSINATPEELAKAVLETTSVYKKD